ncbi:hypothetical protein VaNZ11_014283 [Volvox africanus]|uniref:Adenylate kinase n=1 Tax=Volvox africanus TaxID=51714 RepID=A0ABQ5SJ00_9CHLO|nr:hypothetical protein VaNZ11_014283 [Volvox africanus]
MINMASTGRREEEPSRTGYAASSRAPPQNAKKRAVSSKYDVHKVKVWLGDKRDHYYILSRFLISRSLTITKIPSTKAVKIALELKKHLVDHDKLSVSQDELEETLFSLMREKGYGQAYIDCYRTVSEFYQLRQPLVIILCGAPCTGKSTIAQQLAARLNMPNVMQTDVICELMRRGTGGSLAPQPPWNRSADSTPRPVSSCSDGKGATIALRNGEKEMCDQVSCAVTCGGSSSLDAWLLSEFQSECQLVRRALQGDFNKALNDGKPLIVEGVHLDPGQLLKELQELGIVILPVEPMPVTPASSNPSGQRSPPPPLTEPQLSHSQESGELPGVEEEDLERGGGSDRCSSPLPQPAFLSSSKANPAAATLDGTAGVVVFTEDDIEGSLRVRRPSPLRNSSGPRSLRGNTMPPPDVVLSTGAARKQQQQQQQQGRLCQKHVSWGAVAEEKSHQDGEEGEPEAGSDEGQAYQESEVREDNGQMDGDGEGDERRRGEGGKAARRPRWRHASSRAAAPAVSGTAAAVSAPQRRKSPLATAAAGVGFQLPSHHPNFPLSVQGWEQRHSCLDDTTFDSKGGEGVPPTNDSRDKDHGGHSRNSSEPHTCIAQGTSEATLLAGQVVPLELRHGKGMVDAHVALRLRIMERRSAGREALGCGPLRVRIDATLPSDGSSRTGNLPTAGGSPYQLPRACSPESAELLDGRGSPEQCRWGGASSHGDSSPRASTYNLDDGSSDVNNYGDADTDGDASGGNSPLRGRTPAPRTVKAASSDLDDTFPLIRRAKSHPAISSTGRVDHDQGEDEPKTAAKEQRQDTEVVLQGVLGGSGDELVPDGGTDAAVGNRNCGSLFGTAAQVTLIDGAEAATAISIAASVRGGEAASGATGSQGWGGGGTAARPLDRARSHQMLLSGGSLGHASGVTAGHGISHHLQQSCNPGFYRNASLSTMDLHSFRSSLAGILRMGSVAHGSRLSPSPRFNRVTPLERAGSSCAACPSASGSPSKLTYIFKQAAREQLLPVIPLQHQEPQTESYTPSAQQKQNQRISAAEDEGADSVGAGEPGEALLRAADSGLPGDGGELGCYTTPVQPMRLRAASSAAGAVAAIVAAGKGPEAVNMEIASDDLVSTPAHVKQPQREAHLEGGPATGGAGGGPALPPLFVPVVLCMSKANHRLALEDNTTVYDRGGASTESARVTASGEGLGKRPSEADGPEAEEVLRRAQTIQQYLCTFESQGMPVLNVRYGNFGEALDVLHEYVLMCIQAAMEQLNESRARDGDMGAVAAAQ